MFNIARTGDRSKFEGRIHVVMVDRLDGLDSSASDFDIGLQVARVSDKIAHRTKRLSIEAFRKDWE